MPIGCPNASHEPEIETPIPEFAGFSLKPAKHNAVPYPYHVSVYVYIRRRLTVMTNRLVVSARVNPRTRRLAEVAAEIRGLSLSRFAAEAIEDAVHRQLTGDSTEPQKGTTLISPSPPDIAV